MKLLIIPSAKYISSDLQEQFGRIPTCLMPVNGIPVLRLLLRSYLESKYKILILAKEGVEMIREVLENEDYGKNVELLELDTINDLGYTILFGLSYANKKWKDQLIKITIHFADTLVNDMMKIFQSNDSVFYSIVKESERWTIFDYHNNKITRVIDKEDAEGEYFNGFIGIFNFSNPASLHECFNSVSYSDDTDTFYQALLNYNRKFKLSIIEVNDWLDVGHKDLYLNTRKKFHHRYFNSINLDEKRGILTKTSIDQENFKNEILWYIKLPSKLKYSVPTVYNYSVDFEDMYISMEYYGYNTLSELFLYGNLSKKTWEEILSKIFFILKDFKQFSLKGHTDEIEKSIQEMYVDKTISRLNQLIEYEPFKSYYKRGFSVNGQKKPSINEIILQIPLIYDALEMVKVENLCIIHGDLCFSNILYDVNNAIMRFIDPRGKFGRFDLYGDHRYDIAKLSHSINSRYDFINNNHFQLSYNNTYIEYNVRNNNNSKLVENLFEDFLESYRHEQIYFIESMLFLSMIPLHADSPRKQIAMFATGIELLIQIIKNYT
ncbi:hypothetical protein ACFLR8_01360 [Bacteroidota bacterium]